VGYFSTAPLWIASAKSAAERQFAHGVGVVRFFGTMKDSKSSYGVPASGNSMYETKAKSKPPSHNIVIVTLISLS
jgi:hypothetical protein